MQHFVYSCFCVCNSERSVCSCFAAATTFLAQNVQCTNTLLPSTSLMHTHTHTHYRVYVQVFTFYNVSSQWSPVVVFFCVCCCHPFHSFHSRASCCPHPDRLVSPFMRPKLRCKQMNKSTQTFFITSVRCASERQLLCPNSTTTTTVTATSIIRITRCRYEAFCMQIICIRTCAHNKQQNKSK